MALEYDVYLNDTLLSDVPIGMNDFDLTVIREGGVTSDDQVLRIKTEAELTFWGDGYGIICAAKQANYCQNITVRIVLRCDDYSRLAFIGLLPLVGTISDPTRKTVRARVRDNSFSGYIRERQNNKVFLTATTSANGTAITSCPTRTIDLFTSAGAFTYTNRNVYDVYDVLRWMIKYLSDDTVTVVSDYFGSGAGYHKYAITMGGMLYGGNTWTGQTSLPAYFTPNVSFAEVFREVRKKLRIYMSVDTDVNGVPTVRIEPESYFYSNVELKAITGVPFDLIEEYDIETVYSEIKVGSTETKVDDGTFYTYPKLTLYAFENETYNSCSDCVEENTLNLVSEWIIDSNVISYTLGQAAPDSDANTENGDKVFLIETSSSLDRAAAYQYGTGDYYYNDLLNNFNVLTNWAGGIPACVEATIDKDPCVNLSVQATYNFQHEDDLANPTVSNHLLEFPLVNCNTLGGLVGFDQTNFTQDGASITNDGTIYVAPFSGSCAFTISVDVTNILNYPATIGPLEEYKWELKVYILDQLTDIPSGGTPTTIQTFTETFLVTPDFNTALSNSFSISTGNLSLTAGNVVCACFRIRTDITAAAFSLRDAVRIDSGSFVLDYAYYDINDINFVSDDYLRKPLRWTFTDDLCDSEFIDIIADKRGYMTINGKQGWIKQIDYKPGKASTITLQATDTLCC